MDHPVVLITGALTGIARATALAYAHKGARVVVSGRRDQAGAELAAELQAAGAEAEFIRADVRHEDDVRALVDAAVARFGRLDIAVNSAGTEGKPGPATEQTAESYAATFDTNVLGTVLSMKHELRVMQAQASGSIVNVSSTFGHEGGANASIYAASKHAVEGSDEVGGARGRRVRRAGECGRARPDRHGHARPLHRRGGRQGLSRHAQSAEAASANPTRWRAPSCSSRRTRRRSSPGTS